MLVQRPLSGQEYLKIRSLRRAEPQPDSGGAPAQGPKATKLSHDLGTSQSEIKYAEPDILAMHRDIWHLLPNEFA